jgi:uncharacterized membrane protein required for colicin V production
MNQSIFYFYEFVEKMSFVFAFGFAIIYISVSLALFEDRMTNKESAFCITVAILFVICLFCGFFMNCLQAE